MEPKFDVRTFAFSELRTYQPPIETNDLIKDGILKNNAVLSIIGAAKSFKSFASNTLAVDLAVGRNLFGACHNRHGRPSKAFVIPKPCRVLLIEQEIGELDLRERLNPIYASLSPDEKILMDTGLFTRSLDHRIQLDDDAGFKRLESILTSIKPQPEVLILDPLIEFHTSNENDTQSMGKLMRRFDLLRERYAPLAIVFTHHEGHKNGSNPRQGIDRFRGNTVIGGKVDGAIFVNIYDRRTLKLRLDFVLRRGKPIDSLYLQLDADLRAQFVCWHKDAERRKKLGKSEAEDVDNPETDLIIQ